MRKVKRGVGVDIVYLPRIVKIIAKGDRFAKRVLTPAEFAKYQSLQGKAQVQYLAAHFSVKESFSKAMGTGLGKYVGFQDVETLSDPLGKPVTTSTKFSGRIMTSISDDGDYAITIVQLEAKGWFQRFIDRLKS
ncbi:MAG: holo-ACP synthase [Lactobacillus sp.]|jgi:holo-[acyl-carrier protein] synthase|nr:holo-ACP synthase [Lactobacillus sp.]MCH4068702.1 holo-ACP synthase [Lactobacillus sp.]MCI1303813.1 holo-ACP synthase [Lactobacillus sp.]MCI1330197.1 holo-ACP synthase [Lactobacillus sp.]MCI1359336.1 holo-ACP synthase [Lactobacillus sp.]